MNSILLHSILPVESAGILILACAVIIFAMNQKYSQIVSRIRLLKQEKIKLLAEQQEEAGGKTRTERTDLSNLDLQLSHLIHRISMVRFSILTHVLAILFFITAIVLVVIRPAAAIAGHYWLTAAFILAGLLSMAAGLVLTSIETWKGYRVVKIEVTEIK